MDDYNNRNVCTELLGREVGIYLINHLKELNLDYEKLVNSAAIRALFEIRKVVQNNELDDFEVVERIVCIFEKYNINAGARHDF